MARRSLVYPDRERPHRLPDEAYREVGRVFFLTMCVRTGISLRHPETAREVLRAFGRVALRRCVRIHAYCIMPDHLHIAVSVRERGGDLRSWVRYAKREAAAGLGLPRMWQRSFWDRRVDDGEEPAIVAMYALENPVRAALCERVEEWPYSWSEWYAQCGGGDPNL